MGKSYSGKSVFISYFNEALNQLEYRNTGVVDADGNISFDFNGASKYVVTSEIVAGTLVSKPIGTTGDNNAYVAYYTKNGKEIPVVFSAVRGGKLLYVAPTDAIYEYKNNSVQFSDTDTHWAKTTIDFVTARELFAGVGDNQFDPQGSMTRAMFASVLARLDEVDLSAYRSTSFSDVDMDSWYGSSVSWAAAKGIIKGYGDNTFGVNDTITREQMAVMLSNYIKYKGLDLGKVSTGQFEDMDTVSSWATDAVSDMKKFGLVAGEDSTGFAPKMNASRAVIAQVLKNFINSVLKNRI